MSETDVAQFLDTTELSASQKLKVLASDNKERSFSQTTRWRYTARAGTEYYEFSLMLLHKLGIFILKGLKDQFAENAENCNKAIAQRSTELSMGPF